MKPNIEELMAKYLEPKEIRTYNAIKVSRLCDTTDLIHRILERLDDAIINRDHFKSLYRIECKMREQDLSERGLKNE